MKIPEIIKGALIPGRVGHLNGSYRAQRGIRQEIPLREEGSRSLGDLARYLEGYAAELPWLMAAGLATAHALNVEGVSQPEMPGYFAGMIGTAMLLGRGLVSSIYQNNLEEETRSVEFRRELEATYESGESSILELLKR